MKKIMELLRDFGNSISKDEKDEIHTELFELLMNEEIQDDIYITRFLNKHFIPNAQEQGDLDGN